MCSTVADFGQGAAVPSSRLINRDVVAGRGRTSMRLEPELWDALAEICARERQDISQLVRQIEATGHTGGRTSAVRVFVLKYFRDAAIEAGHECAEHGRLDPSAPRNGVRRAFRPYVVSTGSGAA
jgi:predicted DNA-binding ribbon-helix-helix protein